MPKPSGWTAFDGELEIAKADNIVKYSIDLLVQLSGIHPDSARLFTGSRRPDSSIENAEVRGRGPGTVGMGLP